MNKTQILEKAKLLRSTPSTMDKFKIMQSVPAKFHGQLQEALEYLATNPTHIVPYKNKQGVSTGILVKTRNGGKGIYISHKDLEIFSEIVDVVNEHLA